MVTFAFQFETFFFLIVFQGTPVKDVSLPENASKELLLQKHADYIAAYGNKKDDYVSCELKKNNLDIRHHYLCALILML